MTYENNLRTDTERMVSANEIAALFGVSPRMVLSLPIRQIRLGPRTIRFRLSDVYEHFGVDGPNL